MNKKNFSTIVCIFIFVTNSLLAQTITFSDSIFWQDNKVFRDNDNSSVNILSFKDGSNRNADFLPVYFRKESIPSGNNISKVELIEARYELVNMESLRNIQNLENIQAEPEVKTYISTFRHQKYLGFELVPLRRNETTGTIERLVYFNYKITYVDDPRQRDATDRIYSSASKLSNGKWYKIKVSEPGMYKLTYSQLVDMGFTNFGNIGVFGYGGMVPKVIGTFYIDDLPEVPVYRVDANSNSVFDEGDYLLFYADGPHTVSYNSNYEFSHEFHNYSEFSYYFISDQGSWKQPSTVESLQTSNITVNSYDDYKFLEKDSLNLINSGRRLFWRLFDNKITHNFSMALDNVSLTDSVGVKVVMAAKSTEATNFSVKFNGISSLSNTINSVSGSSTFARIGTFDKKFKTNSNTFNVEITYNRRTNLSKAWLDYIAFSFRRILSLNSGYVQFRDLRSVASGNNAKFVISNAPSNTVVWDITDRSGIFRINGNQSASNYEFIANASTLREYVTFIPSHDFPSPVVSGDSDVGNVLNQNLHAYGAVDLIIVTHPDFYAQAQAIKSLHEQYDNMRVVLATSQVVYNEFSSGTPDVGAIRNFVKMFYDRAGANLSDLPKNLLLVGDGSYDNLSKSASVSNFILTYQSFESLSSSSSYVSDDFFVFMDFGEGADGSANDIDLGVGRIPVKTAEEAENYLNKIKSYYSSDSYSNWKNNILLVSDDADGGETYFQHATARLASKLRVNDPAFNVETIYMDDYEQVATVQGQRYPSVNQALNDAINSGVILVNWIGHGNEKSWAHEIILDLNMIKTWRNTNKYPIFMTGTCDFAPYDLHTIVSAGEEVLLNPYGGGIALFTTTRLVSGNTAEVFADVFLDHVFAFDENSEINTLGMSYAKTKRGVSSGIANKNDFTLLGDPAIRPPLPKLNVQTTKINGVAIEEFRDTIKAKTLVTFEGFIDNGQGNVVENFNGIIYPVVYDKFKAYTTRGNDGYAPLTYEAQKNMIFKGQASVTNGRFSFSFIVPVDIAYFYDEGKISYYANNGTNSEARGYFNEFIIGGAGDNQIVDNYGPVVNLYMNDEQFVSGGITDENPTLLAKLKDESGLNTVGNGIGHDMTLIVDDDMTKTIILNNFYESVIDDFTSGEIKYPMSDLSIGMHTLKVKVWDVFNNSSESSIDFLVASSSELVIDHIFNYPNPFSTNTHFYLAHNQPNIKLDVLIQIFTVSGKHVKTIRTDIYSDGFQSQPIHWDGRDEYNDKIAKGVYIYKVSVKSPNGNMVEKYEKLMILN